jgi:hypothetical protein
MLFNDLLDAEDYDRAIHALAREFRVKHGLDSPGQLGLVVKNVEETAGKLEAQGIGPFLILDGSAKLWCERGQARAFRGKMGLAYHRGVELELLEPGEGSDFYRQSLDPAGGITLQHLGFRVQDIEAWTNKLVASDVPVWIRGKLQTGPLTVDFVYLDTVAETGYVIELICWRLFGLPFRVPAGVEHGLGWLEKWSGKRSITA